MTVWRWICLKVVPLLTVALVGSLALLESPAVAAQTVTLGPTLPTGTGIAGGNCGQADCTYFTSASSSFSVVAPADGTITSWSVELFSGTARLVIIKAGAGNSYSIVAQSAPVTEPCVINNGRCLPPANAFYTVPTNLPISAGEFIGIRSIQPANCGTDTPVDCTIVGNVPLGNPQGNGGNVEVFNPTPALNTPAVPGFDSVPPYTVSAVEQEGSQPISITAIKFEQLNVGSDLVETVPSSGTIDGNQVDVVVTLHNSGATAQQTNVSFGSPVDDSASVGITQSGVSVPAGGSVNVDEKLDTSGLAWNDSGTPHAQRSIKITLTDGTSSTATLTVRPKPVILVHGIWSSAVTWDAYVGGGGFLANENILWRGYAVGDGQVPGAMDTSPFQSPGNTIAQNAFQEAMYIQGVRDSADAEHVDIVAHSLGGLISRYYLQELMPGQPPQDSRPVVSHLVMIGTPNEGSNCAYDALGAELLFGISHVSSANQPLLQLTPGYLAGFNKQITNARGVPFSILAGTGFGNQSACTNLGGGPGPGLPNDGVVTEPSAWWTISDRSAVPLIHTSETSSKLAFTQWVMPHIALGPTASGGGTYQGPLVAADGVGAHRDVAIRAKAVAGVRARPAAASKAKLCLMAAPVPPLSAGETATVRAGRTVSMAIRVPAHAGRLSAVVLAQPTVTTRLVDPQGHTAQTTAAGSSAARGLFRTLTVSSPRAGTWHLNASSAARAGTSPVVIAVQFAHPPLEVKLSMLQVGSKRKRASRGTTLRFTARVNAGGRAASGARVIVELLVAGQRAVVLHLRAVHGHTGSYAAQSAPLKHPVGAVVLVRAGTSAGSTSSIFQLQTGCAKSS